MTEQEKKDRYVQLMNIDNGLRPLTPSEQTELTLLELSLEIIEKKKEIEESRKRFKKEFLKRFRWMGV
jgi:hypothetical protein